MSRVRLAVVPILLALILSRSRADEPVVVGEQGAGRVVVPTNQVLTPAGRLVTFPGRPVDLALLDEGKTVAIKNLRDLVLLDATTGTILQTLRLPSGGHAVAGLAVAGGGATIYSSGTGGKVHVARREGGQGPYRWADPFALPEPAVGGDPRRPDWRWPTTARRCWCSRVAAIPCCGSTPRPVSRSARRLPSAWPPSA